MGQYDACMLLWSVTTWLADDGVAQVIEPPIGGSGLDGAAEWAWWPILIGAVLVCLLIVLNRAKPEALRLSPPRAVRLGGMDLLMGLILMFAGLIAAQAVISVIALTPINWLSLDRATGSLTYRSQAVQFGTLIFMQLCAKGPVVVYLLHRLRQHHDGSGRFGLGLARPGRDLLLFAVGFVTAFALIFAFNNVVVMVFDLFGREVPQAGHEMLHLLPPREWSLALALLLTSTVLVAPVLEEVVYRGMVQTALLNLLGRNRRWMVIQLASIIFALIHGPMVPWYLLPSLYLLGLVLGWIYERYASLWPCILIHMAFNGANVWMAMMMMA